MYKHCKIFSVHNGHCVSCISVQSIFFQPSSLIEYYCGRSDIRFSVLSVYMHFNIITGFVYMNVSPKTFELKSVFYNLYAVEQCLIQQMFFHRTHAQIRTRAFESSHLSAGTESSLYSVLLLLQKDWYR